MTHSEAGGGVEERRANDIAGFFAGSEVAIQQKQTYLKFNCITELEDGDRVLASSIVEFCCVQDNKPNVSWN